MKKSTDEYGGFGQLQILLDGWLESGIRNQLLCRCAQLGVGCYFFFFYVRIVLSLFSYFFNLKIVVVDREG
jgi:hypothetical protein